MARYDMVDLRQDQHTRWHEWSGCSARDKRQEPQGRPSGSNVNSRHDHNGSTGWSTSNNHVA